MIFEKCNNIKYFHFFFFNMFRLLFYILDYHAVCILWFICVMWMCKINLSLNSAGMRNNDINTYSIRSINYILRNYFLYARFLYDCIVKYREIRRNIDNCNYRKLEWFIKLYQLLIIHFNVMKFKKKIFDFVFRTIDLTI